MTMCGCKFYLLMLIMNFDWVWTLDYPMKTKWGIWKSGVWKPWSAQEEEWCVFGTMVDTRRNDAFLEPWSPQQEEQYFVWNPDQHRRRNNVFFGTLISTRGGMVFFQNWLLNHWVTIKYHLITLFNNLSLWNWIFL